MAVSFRNLVLPLLLLVSASLQAQPATPTPPGFKLWSINGVHQFYFEGDEGEKRIFASESSLSTMYNIPKKGEVTLYQLERPVEEGAPLRKVPKARIEFPEGDGPFLVVIAPANTGTGDAFITRVLDHSLEVHPSENIRLFNLSSRGMAVSTGEDRFALRSGESQVVPYTDKSKVWMQIAAQTNGKWERVFGAPSVVAPNTRMIFAVYDIPPTEADPNPTAVRVLKILETIITTEEGSYVQ